MEISGASLTIPVAKLTRVRRPTCNPFGRIDDEGSSRRTASQSKLLNTDAISIPRELDGRGQISSRKTGARRRRLQIEFSMMRQELGNGDLIDDICLGIYGRVEPGWLGSTRVGSKRDLANNIIISQRMSEARGFC